MSIVGGQGGVEPLPSISQLLRATCEFYGRHARIVLLVTFPVVAIVDVIIGAGLGELTAGVHRKLPVADDYIALAGPFLVTVPLVTSMIGRAVVIERDGAETLAATRIAEQGLDLFLPALVAWIIFALGVLFGSILILPGIYLFVAGYFVVQAVVLDGYRASRALVASIEAVRGHWWYSAGVIICFALLSELVSGVVIALFQALARALDGDAIVIAGNILTETLALPFTAIGLTLYYLELRKRATMPRVG